MKKLGLICLVLVIAIASIGVAYARWSQTFTLDGSVATGTFDVVFDSFTKPSTTNGATFGATKVDNHTYNITLSNLYPGLDATFDFVLKDSGTIPAKITDVKIDGSSVTGTNYKQKKDLPTADGSNDISVTVQNITTSTTIATGGTVTGHLLVHTWLKSSDGNDATPSASGSFTIEIDTAQRY